MSVAEIEKAIESLTPEEFAQVRDWILERDADEWDRQIESDASTGKLDRFADEALKDFDEGRFKRL